MKNACKTLLGQESSWLVAAVVFGLVVLLLGYVYLCNKTKANTRIFKYRYVIAFAVLAVCVLFELSGSSIGQWASSLPGAENDGLIFGRPRGCRTDEYALFTGMSFAQYYDPQGSWPYFGEVMRATTTDMFMIYGQPVLDPSILLRPFQIGFLVFGLSRGISFFWSARLIALFMASFELGRVITKDKRGLSLAYAALVALAPTVSWWFSINSLVEMIICLSVIAVCFSRYVLEESKRKRILLIVLCAYACLVFIFSIYPAWQVPLAYVLLAIVVAIAIQNRSGLRVALKADKLPLVLCAVAAIACVAAVAVHSFDAIIAEMNTDYPGDRNDVGGSYGLSLFRYPIALFLAFVAPSASSGLSIGLPEVLTAFMDFFPLGVVLAAVTYIRTRRIDPVSVGLIVSIVFLGAYIALGFPELVAKLTLMGKTIPARAIVAFSFANLLLLFREISKFARPEKLGGSRFDRGFAVVVVCVCVVAAACLTALCWMNDENFLGGIKLAVVFVCLLLVWVVVVFGKQKLFIAACIAIAVVSGGFVNPVQRGIDVVDQNPLITQMRQVAKENPGVKWVGALDWMSNITLFAGVPSINSTNIYPNEELWKVLDPSGESKEVWNRYAHLHCKIVSEGIGHSFNLTQLDSISISLTLDDLKKLDVGLIVSVEPVSLPEKEMACLEVISTCGSFVIYKLIG